MVPSPKAEKREKLGQFRKILDNLTKILKLDTLTKQANQQSSYLIISCVHCTVLAMQIQRIHNRNTLTCSYCYISICALFQCCQPFQFTLETLTIEYISLFSIRIISRSINRFRYSSVLFLFEAASDFCCSLQLSNSFRLLSDHLYSIPRIQLYKATKSYTQGIRYKVLLSYFDASIAIWFTIHSNRNRVTFSWKNQRNICG